MTAPLSLTTNSAAETQRIAAALGLLLHGGEVLALSGPLGAGKTAFVKGLALGLGIAPNEPVTSPTFVLVREYRGRLTLIHIDAFRISGAEDLLALGFEEMHEDPQNVIAIEWADRCPAIIPPTAIFIELSYGDSPDSRKITITWIDEPRNTALDAAIGQPRP